MVVQQTQKPSWKCVLCGQKQSYTRIFASGPAKECRPVVQRLNMARGEVLEQPQPPPLQPPQLPAERRRQHPHDDEDVDLSWVFGDHENMAWQQQPPQLTHEARARQGERHRCDDDDAGRYVTALPERRAFSSTKKRGRAPPSEAVEAWDDWHSDWPIKPPQALRRLPGEHGAGDATDRSRYPHSMRAEPWLHAQSARAPSRWDGAALAFTDGNGAGAGGRMTGRAVTSERCFTVAPSEVVEEEVWQG